MGKRNWDGIETFVRRVLLCSRGGGKASPHDEKAHTEPHRRPCMIQCSTVSVKLPANLSLFQNEKHGILS